MNPTLATSAPVTTGNVHFLNLEYLFYQLYQWLHGSSSVSGPGVFNFSALISSLTILWVVITVLAYAVALGFLALLIYSTMRMYQVQDEEGLRYVTIADVGHAEDATEHHRWNHVRELIESPQDSDWRQAIIEADIILDDMLTRLGYHGAGVGEKLKSADPSHFKTLNEAWEAHKVRNEIAHQGSAYPLTDHIAYRTILHYENVFKEHGEI